MTTGPADWPLLDPEPLYDWVETDPPATTQEEPVSRWNVTNKAGEDRGSVTGTRHDAVATGREVEARTGEHVYVERDGTTVHLSDGTAR